MSWAIVMVCTSLSTIFWILGISGSGPWGSYATWLQGTTGELIVGTLAMAVVFLISLQPSRRFHTINSALVVGGLILTLIAVPFAMGINPTSFASNLQTITGKSAQQFMDAATSGGFSVGAFDVTLIGPLLGFVVFEYAGLNYSGFIAGELKGNLTRNVLISVVGTCIVVLLIHSVYLQLFVNGVGYSLLAALSYLFVSSSPQSPFAPTAQVLIAVGNPTLAGLMAFSALAAVLLLISCMVCIIVVLSRTAFAWAMDRLIPTRFSEINPRTKTPLLLTILFAAIWYVTFLISLYGVNYIVGVYAYLMLSVLFFIMPGINAILLPYRRKDIYELLPLSMRKKFGIPLVAIFGIVWLAFIIPGYTFFMVWPMIQGAAGMTNVVSYAISQGLLTFVVILIAGVVIYFASRWYNTKHGIDMSLLFKSVPPE
jgi:amino acid transporter